MDFMSLCQGYLVNWPFVATPSSFHNYLHGSFKIVVLHNKHDRWPFSTPLCVCVCVLQQPHLGLGRFVFEVSISHTIMHTDMSGRTPLNEISAGRRGRYIHNAQQTQDMNIHAVRETRTRNSTIRAATDLRLTLYRHWYQRI